MALEVLPMCLGSLGLSKMMGRELIRGLCGCSEVLDPSAFQEGSCTSSPKQLAP